MFMATKLRKCVAYMTIITWSFEITWQTKNCHFHNAYGHKIWQDGDFLSDFYQ